MASADFSYHIPTPLGDGSTLAWYEISPGNVLYLHTYVRRIYDNAFRIGLGL